MGEMSRRTLGKLFLAVPVASWAARPASAAEPPSEAAEFIASHEPGLSAEERERLRKSLGEQEKALKTVREFTLPADVAPALHFRPLPSRKR
ncbi:MAG TPA: hypothetical protein VN083_09695 [Vicinamibacteria bacterium]|nr:hypothetical protein [Vicinamibacteria bacterium]